MGVMAAVQPVGPSSTALWLMIDHLGGSPSSSISALA